MKSITTLGTATRTVGKVFLALMLLALAGVVGFGGTALFVYRQFGDKTQLAAQSARGVAADRRTQARSSQNVAGGGSQTRQVAALSSDRGQYAYADNNGGGRTTTPDRRTRQATGVPAPLDTPSQDAAPSEEASRLNDPESHYITDSRTGRVIGIDGSVGARREEEQDRLQQMETPPRAFAVQTPPPEVRVASPVTEDGQAVFGGAPVSSVNMTSSLSIPVRKALPVNPDQVAGAPRASNAGEYMPNEQDRPVLRAQAVVPPGARVVRTVHIYRLPDGSQAVAAD